jgi:cysteine protease ATG4
MPDVEGVAMDQGGQDVQNDTKDIYCDRFDGLGRMESIKLTATQAYYSLSGALRLNKLLHLFRKAHIDGSSPIWIVGHDYFSVSEDVDLDEVLSQVAVHVQSIPYMTYRKGFLPLDKEPGFHAITSDSGWGCTLRVSQMMAALSLVRAARGDEASNAHILRYFMDKEDIQCAPLSIHTIMKHGEMFGAVPGRWMGPYVASQSISRSINKCPDVPLRAHVVHSQGGAPVMYAETLRKELVNISGDPDTPILLLIPLVLGSTNTIQDVYSPQVLAVLEIQQSVGIIGGSSSSSYFFIGHQGDHVVYLDPHIVQPAVTDVDNDEARHTYVCDVVQTLHVSSMDSSAAFGFLLRDLDKDYDELLLSLRVIEERHSKHPMMMVQEGTIPSSWVNLTTTDSSWLDDEDNDCTL